MDRLGILERKEAVFVMVDMQDKLLDAMHGKEELIQNANKLLKASEILGIPLLVTEQYPEGLGKTSGSLSLPPGTKPIKKMSFSCFAAEDFAAGLHALEKTAPVIFGTEAHICVLKTALDGLRKGMQVHVAADAVSSRRERDRDFGLERMRQSGVFVSPAETILFQLMDKAGSEEFKAVSRLIK